MPRLLKKLVYELKPRAKDYFIRDDQVNGVHNRRIAGMVEYSTALENEIHRRGHIDNRRTSIVVCESRFTMIVDPENNFPATA